MIILTGASGGIGKELVGHLTKIDDVIGLYNTNAPEKSDINNLAYEKVNLSNKADIDAFIKKWGPKIEKITVINAAVYKVDDLVVNLKESDWDKMMDVNLKGNFLLSQALIPRMIQQNWGRIIHVSSLGGIQGSVGTAAYSACKTALIGLSNALSKEYARFGITSNIVVLGYFGTGLYNSQSEAEKQKQLNKVPSKTLGDVSNISNAVEFLIKSQYVNGASINIDGASD